MFAISDPVQRERDFRNWRKLCMHVSAFCFRVNCDLAYRAVSLVAIASFRRACALRGVRCKSRESPPLSPFPPSAMLSRLRGAATAGRAVAASAARAAPSAARSSPVAAAASAVRSLSTRSALRSGHNSAAHVPAHEHGALSFATAPGQNTRQTEQAQQRSRHDHTNSTETNTEMETAVNNRDNRPRDEERSH